MSFHIPALHWKKPAQEAVRFGFLQSDLFTIPTVGTYETVFPIGSTPPELAPIVNTTASRAEEVAAAWRLNAAAAFFPNRTRLRSWEGVITTNSNTNPAQNYYLQPYARALNGVDFKAISKPVLIEGKNLTVGSSYLVYDRCLDVCIPEDASVIFLLRTATPALGSVVQFGITLTASFDKQD